MSQPHGLFAPQGCGYGFPLGNNNCCNATLGSSLPGNRVNPVAFSYGFLSEPQKTTWIKATRAAPTYSQLNWQPNTYAGDAKPNFRYKFSGMGIL